MAVKSQNEFVPDSQLLGFWVLPYRRTVNEMLRYPNFSNSCNLLHVFQGIQRISYIHWP